MQHHSLFSDKSDLYASARPYYPTEVFDYIASLCVETKMAWDCACGNGQAAADLVKRFDSVIATDVSKEQIAHAKHHPKINYKVAPSEHTDIPDNSLDLVCVAQAIHWFDYETFWPEVNRVLKQGGVLTAFAYKMPTINPQIDQLMQDKILNVIEPFWAPQNQLITDDYKDISFPFKKIHAPTFQMSARWNLDQLFALIHTFSATRRCMDSQGDAFFEQAYASAKKIWGDKLSTKTTNFDFVFYAGRNN